MIIAIFAGPTALGGAAHGATFSIGNKILAHDGAAFDDFGFSVAISVTTAIVGAFGDDDKGSSSGSAYIYRSPDVTSVPLPAGAWLLLGGLAALGVARRAGPRA